MRGRGVESAEGTLFQQKALDTISVQDGMLRVDFHRMEMYIAILAIFFMINGTLIYCQGIISAKLSMATVHLLRKELFKKIAHLPVSYIDSHRHGDIMSRMTNDVENISVAVSQSTTALISAVLTLTGAIVMMLYYNGFMTLAAIITIPIAFVISRKFSGFMQKYYIRQQQLLGQLNGIVEEKVTGFRTVSAYGKEEDAIVEFVQISDELRINSIKARVWSTLMGPIMNFLGNLQYVFLAGTGGYLMLNHYPGVSIGMVQAMLQYSKKVSHPLNMIANQYASILTALAGAERIFEILDTADEIDEGTLDLFSQEDSGNIEFKNVTFGYQTEKKVLNHFNFVVNKGEKVAIVGATGSGKTTIVNLLTRFYELDEGGISIGTIDITSVPKRILRKEIGIVLQDTVLFHDTIRNNIRFGNREASNSMIEQAAELAMADRFIRQLPDGFETILQESGENLSEGQRQMIAIARAFLANPEILVLDEATSSVDTCTEMKIQQALVNLMKNRTSLIIAHRISTIRDADVIIVLKDGAIVESGSHEELLEKGGEYFQLYKRQFSGIET